MQCSVVERYVRRPIRWGALLRALPLLLLPALSGCLPGLSWGGDDNEPGAAAPESQQGAPALNRSYKSNFLAIQMPTFGAPRIQGLLMPDSGPAVLTAFATVETRKPGQPGLQWGGERGIAPGFEPAVLPPAESLHNFYNALSALAARRRTQPLTILHFGGDRIVDDHFAGTLRDLFTGRFGSAGRGLMMPGLFPVRGMKVDRGGQWTLSNAAGSAEGPFGITGARMTAAHTDAWMRFTSAQSPFDWLEVTFLTGPGFGSAILSVDGNTKLVPTLGAGFNETTIQIPTKSREILIKPRGDGPISVLSVATGTNTPGILYSNLGLPGASATTSAKWTPDLAAGELRRINPDLILLDYGTSEGFDEKLDPRQYEIRLRLVIDQIKQWAPQASILIAGPPDGARLPAFAGSAGTQVCRALNPPEIAAYTGMMERADGASARRGGERLIFLGLGKIYGRPLLHSCLDLGHATACRAGPQNTHRGRIRPLRAGALRRSDGWIRRLSAGHASQGSGSTCRRRSGEGAARKEAPRSAAALRAKKSLPGGRS
jgi:hypothetical protein